MPGYRLRRLEHGDGEHDGQEGGAEAHGRGAAGLNDRGGGLRGRRGGLVAGGDGRGGDSRGQGGRRGTGDDGGVVLVVIVAAVGGGGDNNGGGADGVVVASGDSGGGGGGGLLIVVLGLGGGGTGRGDNNGGGAAGNGGSSGGGGGGGGRAARGNGGAREVEAGARVDVGADDAEVRVGRGRGVTEDVPPHVGLAEQRASNVLPEALGVLSVGNALAIGVAAHGPAGLGDPDGLATGGGAGALDSLVEQLLSVRDVVVDGVLEVGEAVEAEPVGGLDNGRVRRVIKGGPRVDVAVRVS